MLDVKPGYRLLLLGRCLIGTLNMFCLFSSIKYISSSQTTLIMNISPLLIGILSYFILKEKIYKSTVIALVGSFAGVTLFSLHKSESAGLNGNFMLGLCYALVSCFCSSVITIIIRRTNQEVHYTLTPFYFSITTMTVAIMLLALYPSVYNFKYYRFIDVLLFVISGLFNYLTNLTKSIALAYGNASFVAPFNYLQVLLLLICDLTLFGYTFSLIDYIGVSLTFSCVSFPVFQKLVNSKKTAPKG